MIPALTNHLWQSTLFVVAAGLLAMALRQNGAHVRHRIWLIASVKFLVPFSILMSLGSALPSFTPAETTSAVSSTPDLSIAVDRIAEPFTSDAFTSSTPATSSATTNWTAVVLGAWACGFVAVALMRVRDWRRVRAAVRASLPLTLVRADASLKVVAAGLQPCGLSGGLKPTGYDNTVLQGGRGQNVPVRSAPGLLEPGVVGLFRPVLLVPAGIEHQLTAKQLEAVLAHELCHVKRRDNLTSAIHMVVESLFWFHPLVWFVGARLVDERERACDEHVLRVCGAPQIYAESILNVCKLYVESPIACVSGVGGADVRKRVAAILVNQIGLQLSLIRKVTLVISAVLAIALPLAAGMLIAPVAVRAEAQSAKGEAGTTSQVPKFDVVSVKPCEPNAPGQVRGAAGQTPITSPGRLYLQCYPLSTLFGEAYVFFADGRAHYLGYDMTVGVEGGPDWMKTDRYTIEAKTEQTPPAAVMRGPMLRALLEDRFKLKVRHETRELPIYELVVAKSGAKVAPYTGTDCVVKDDAAWPPIALPAGQRYCGDRSHADGDRFIREGVTTLDQLASFIPFDRPVVNKTGITAAVGYRLEYSTEDKKDVTGAPSASFIAALRNQLGLDIRASKGPRDFLIIDHAERPTPDSPSPIASYGRGFGGAGSARATVKGAGR